MLLDDLEMSESMRWIIDRQLMVRHDGHAVFSRAYVLFKTPEAVMEFRQAYDGHVFRSKTGQSSLADLVAWVSDL